ncbi:MAG TPA: hypothetical protein VGM26_10190 [Rhizomicrobium sp.]|jgi:hypothetical protein
MIFRAIFWVGLVSLLMPHEPDLGFGRPGAGTSPSSAAILSSVTQSLQTDKKCGFACAGGLGLPDLFHLDINGRVAAGLADVKAQIRADQKARAARAGMI